MRTSLITVGILLAALLAVPFVMSWQRREAAPPENALRLVIVTPHVQQIRTEWARAFDRWHRENHGEPVVISWRTPGGTSEIIDQLRSQGRAAVQNGRAQYNGQRVVLEQGAVGYDLMFGGGSYDHGQLKAGIAADADKLQTQPDTQLPESPTLSLSAPAGLGQDFLDQRLGENAIGPQLLYDPQQYWIGTALSSFGIVYNKDLVRELGVGTPDGFDSLESFGYYGWLALADPRKSGSITTTFDSILGSMGWEQGFRLLRAMSGNARYFTDSSTKPPLDVAAGEAAAGLAIDFYGRGQAQATRGDRVGYIEPKGSVYVDADPVSLLNGAPNPELARRFITFSLSDEAQLLWQLPPTGTNADDDTPGPRTDALRRLPIVRGVYDTHGQQFLDAGVDPFELVSDVENPGWRTGIQKMMGAFGIDAASECTRAWAALNRLKEARTDTALVNELQTLFFSFPETPVTVLSRLDAYKKLPKPLRDTVENSIDVPDGQRLNKRLLGEWLRTQEAKTALTAEQRDQLGAVLRAQQTLPFNEANYRAVRDEWRDPFIDKASEILYTTYFRDTYAQVTRRAQEALRTRATTARER